MRITVRRTGGFSGLTQVWTVDTRTLAHRVADDVERSARAATDGPVEERHATMADGFQWEVAIDGKPHAVPDGSPAWMHLIDRVLSLDQEE